MVIVVEVVEGIAVYLLLHRTHELSRGEESTDPARGAVRKRRESGGMLESRDVMMSEEEGAKDQTQKWQRRCDTTPFKSFPVRVRWPAPTLCLASQQSHLRTFCEISFLSLLSLSLSSISMSFFLLPPPRVLSYSLYHSFIP